MTRSTFNAADADAVILRAVAVLVEAPEPVTESQRHRCAQTCPGHKDRQAGRTAMKATSVASRHDSMAYRSSDD